MFCLLHKKDKQPIITRVITIWSMVGPDIGVGVAVIKDEKILLVKETAGRNKNCWGMPKGKVDPAENIEQAALRELKEETGLDGDLMKLTGLRSDIRHDQVALFFVFTAEITGSEEPQIQNHEEICEIGWFTLEETRSLELVSTNMSLLIQGAFSENNGLRANDGNGVVYV